MERLTTAANNVTLMASGLATISLYTLPSNVTFVRFTIYVVNVTGKDM